MQRTIKTIVCRELRRTLCILLVTFSCGRWGIAQSSSDGSHLIFDQQAVELLTSPREDYSLAVDLKRPAGLITVAAPLAESHVESQDPLLQRRAILLEQLRDQSLIFDGIVHAPVDETDDAAGGERVALRRLQIDQLKAFMAETPSLLPGDPLPLTGGLGVGGDLDPSQLVDDSGVLSFADSLDEVLVSGTGTGYAPVVPNRRSPWWSTGEGLAWWIQGNDTTPLLTSSPVGTPGNIAGQLGQPTTTVLYGAHDDLRLAGGARLTLGRWFDPTRHFNSLEGEVFGVSQSGGFFGSSADGIITRPFFNTNPAVNGPDTQIIALPGLADGTFNVSTNAELLSVAPRWRHHLQCADGVLDNYLGDTQNRFDFLLGYRFLQLKERLAATEVLIPEGPQYAMGSRLELYDQIGTDNRFHGLEFGLSWLQQRGRWSTQLTPLLAVGQVTQKYRLQGETSALIPGVYERTIDGGFLVRPENIGEWTEREWGILPQGRVNLGYRLSANVRLQCGYDLLYLYSVARPGSLATTSFDSSTLAVEANDVGAEQPTFDFRGVWIQGVNVGMTVRF